jgi:hypothetical protein
MGNVENVKKTIVARRVHGILGTFCSGQIIARWVELLHVCERQD